MRFNGWLGAKLVDLCNYITDEKNKEYTLPDVLQCLGLLILVLSIGSALVLAFPLTVFKVIVLPDFTARIITVWEIITLVMPIFFSGVLWFLGGLFTVCYIISTIVHKIADFLCSIIIYKAPKYNKRRKKQ